MHPRNSVNRGRSYGEEAWMDDIAENTRSVVHGAAPETSQKESQNWTMHHDARFIPPSPFALPKP